VQGWAKTHNVGVMFNEWGAGWDSHNYDSIMDFYQYYVYCAVKYNFAPIAWDDGGMF
jgi:hypothetical protein